MFPLFIPEMSAGLNFADYPHLFHLDPAVTAI
jgi:hypothetical protein